MPTITTDIARPWEKSPFREVFAYWDSVRGQELVPRRSDIKPEKLGSALNEIAIIEKKSGDFFFRLYSSGLRERVQADITGMRVLDFSVPWAVDHSRKTWEKSLSHPAAAFGQLRNYFSDELDHEPTRIVIVDCFYLPMAQDDGTTNLLLTLYHLATPEHQKMAHAKVYGGTEMLDTYFYDIGAGAPLRLMAPDRN